MKAKDGEILSFDDIDIGSIWMAADGSSFGHCVVGKDEDTEDIIVHPFDSRGWGDLDRDIDWFKLQYRYYQVA